MFYETYNECIEANKNNTHAISFDLVDPLRLGVWLENVDYGDNAKGLVANPTWELSATGFVHCNEMIPSNSTTTMI